MSHPEKFPLFGQLPTEIREIIWEHAIRPARPGAHWFDLRRRIATPQRNGAEPFDWHYIAPTRRSRSICLVDCGLWAACTEPRSALLRVFETELSDRSTGQLLGDHRHLTVAPGQDLFFLDLDLRVSPTEVFPNVEMVLWEGLPPAGWSEQEFPEQPASFLVDGPPFGRNLILVHGFRASEDDEFNYQASLESWVKRWDTCRGGRYQFRPFRFRSSSILNGGMDALRRSGFHLLSKLQTIKDEFRVANEDAHADDSPSAPGASPPLKRPLFILRMDTIGLIILDVPEIPDSVSLSPEAKEHEQIINQLHRRFSGDFFSGDAAAKVPALATDLREIDASYNKTREKLAIQLGQGAALPTKFLKVWDATLADQTRPKELRSQRRAILLVVPSGVRRLASRASKIENATELSGEVTKFITYIDKLERRNILLERPDLRDLDAERLNTPSPRGSRFRSSLSSPNMMYRVPSSGDESQWSSGQSRRSLSGRSKWVGPVHKRAWDKAEREARSFLERSNAMTLFQDALDGLRQKPDRADFELQRNKIEAWIAVVTLLKGDAVGAGEELQRLLRPDSTQGATGEEIRGSDDWEHVKREIRRWLGVSLVYQGKYSDGVAQLEGLVGKDPAKPATTRYDIVTAAPLGTQRTQEFDYLDSHKLPGFNYYSTSKRLLEEVLSIQETIEEGVPGMHTLEGLRFEAELAHVECRSGNLERAERRVIHALKKQRQLFDTRKQRPEVVKQLAPEQEPQSTAEADNAFVERLLDEVKEEPRLGYQKFSTQPQQSLLLSEGSRSDLDGVPSQTLGSHGTFQQERNEVPNPDLVGSRNSAVSRHSVHRVHPLLLYTLRVLALIRLQLGSPDEKQVHRMLELVWKWQRQPGSRGPTHPVSLTTEYDYAVALRGFGDHEKAKDRFQHVFLVRTEVLGPSHPDTTAAKRELDITMCLVNCWKYPDNPLVSAKQRDGTVTPLDTESQAKPEIGIERLADNTEDASPGMDSDDWDQVEECSQAIWTQHQNILGKRHPETLKSLTWMFTLQLLLSKIESADLTCDSLLDTLRSNAVVSERLLDAVQMEGRLAQVYMEQSQENRAERILEHLDNLGDQLPRISDSQQLAETLKRRIIASVRATQQERSKSAEGSGKSSFDEIHSPGQYSLSSETPNLGEPGAQQSPRHRGFSKAGSIHEDPRSPKTDTLDSAVALEGH
ncbi:hypothetical protein OQA88_9321 [Cercophora sp. LCS_1]